MRTKYIQFNDSLFGYLCASHSHAPDPVLNELRQETESLGDDARMQISPDQGSFMTLLTAAIGARHAIEVGTFTGYSSICIARGLAAGGKLLCLDASKEWTDIARRYWDKAGVADRIELRLGPAIDLLKQLSADDLFDLAFIDAAKTEYEEYYELILPRMRKNGLILFDNMLWGGRVGQGAIDDPDGRAIDELNRKLPKDRRVECVLLSIADGIQLCRKL